LLLNHVRRLRAERSVRESEARFRNVADAAPVLIWTAGTDQRCTFVNKGWLDFTGRKLEREVGNGWTEGIQPEDLQRSLDVYTNAFDRRQEFTMEYRLRSASGEYRWVLDNGVPHVSPTGEFLGYIGSAIDITERKLGEERFRQVVEAEAESKQQRDELAHLSRVAMLGELSGSLAHELNQPLTAILCNAQAAQKFLEREPADLAEIGEILRDIEQDDNRAGEIIRRLRLLLTKGELQRYELDVNETIRDVLKLINSDLLNHGVTIETTLPEELGRVNADRVQVQQVLLNLIVNGCDAMAQVQPSDRRLSLTTTAVNGTGVEVRITDRGCGIPSGQLEQVFKPFFTTKTHGMGLGLAVCRTIVAAHGGRLWATNNHDAGATFHVELPLLTTEGAS
jgi:PAS domain S-box-containing protein